MTPHGVVKVLDMGLALLYRPAGEGSSTTVTPEGAVMSTPDYMAPEQSLDSHLVDIRADLYALGCTLYFLLAGRVPFPGGTLGEKIARHQMREPAPVKQVRPDTPPAVAAVVRKLMAKRPEDRFQTPAEAAAALEAATRGAPAPAAVARRPAESEDAFASFDRTLTAHETLTVPGWMERRGRKRAELRRLLFYALGGLASLGAACLIGALVVHFVTPRPPAAPPPQTQRETPRTAAVPDDKAAKAAAFDRWVKQTAALPAEQQVKAVAEKLKELNPRFDGTVHPTIEGGVVIAFWFATDEVTDISPVRALQGLTCLGCGGSGDGGPSVTKWTALPSGFQAYSEGHGRGRLADLSPLKGMNLVNVSCSHTEVSDLSALAGMPLITLACADTKVSDLSPLTGKPLTVLYCFATPVADLKPLRGITGGYLDIDRTAVSDLSPLKGMKLPSSLYCRDTAVSDLSPLKDVPLLQLGVTKTKVSDLSPLKGMNLTDLDCQDTAVADLSPLKGMPLKNLWCDFQPMRDAETLRSIKTLEMINGQPAAQVLGPGAAPPKP